MANERPRRRRGTSNATGNGGKKDEAELTPQPVTEEKVVDLNSKSATNVANIVFRRAQQYNFPVIQFECRDCLRTCQYIREWLQSGPQIIQPLLRIEDQELNRISPHAKGILLLFDSAATLDGDPSAPITVFSLYIPGDRSIRYFWTLLSPSPLLTDLTARDFVGPATEIPYFDKPPRRSKFGGVLPPLHHSLLTLVSQSFSKATTFPDSEAYRTASQISDLCPPILEPDTAHARIEGEEDLHPAHTNAADGKEPSDDRYLLELPLAERALASLVNAYCAEYLLIKRQYFRAFSRETILHAEKVRRAAAYQQNEQRHATPAGTADDGEDSPADTPNSTPLTTRSRGRSRSESSVAVAQPATYHTARMNAAQSGARNRALRVRTKHNHIRTVEAQSGWNFARARRLVRGWEILGFLDEERVLAVLEGDDDDDEEGSDGE